MAQKKYFGEEIVGVLLIFAFFFFGVVPTGAQTTPAKTFNWRLQCAYPPPEKIMGYWGAYGQAVEVARRVKERSQGGLDIKVFVPEALFKALETPDAVKRGAVEMVVGHGTYHASILPEGILEFGLPYGVRTSQEAAGLLLDTDYPKILRKAYAEKHQVYFLGVTSTSTLNYVTRFPIHKMEDMKGKKIRAPGAYGKVVSAHGGASVNLTAAEQYMGLQRGTVDGVVFPAYAGITYKLFEVAKYHSWPPLWAVVGANYLVNMSAWNKLPKEYQDILQEEMTKMARYAFEVSGPALEKIAQEEGKKQFGAEAVFLSDAEFAKFRDAVMPLWEEWAKKSDYCAQLVKIARDFSKK